MEVSVKCRCESREFSICPSLEASRYGGKDTDSGVAEVEGQLNLFTAVCAGATHPASLSILLFNWVTDLYRAVDGIAFVKVGKGPWPAPVPQ